jgi:hypothetical protein
LDEIELIRQLSAGGQRNWSFADGTGHPHCWVKSRQCDDRCAPQTQQRYGRRYHGDLTRNIASALERAVVHDKHA